MYHIVIAGLTHGGPYLSRQHKPVAVYVAPKRRFLTVEVFDDLKHVLAEVILTASNASSANFTSIYRRHSNARHPDVPARPPRR